MTRDPHHADEEEAAVRDGSRGWVHKFGDACRGVKIAVRGEVSFFVHLFATVIVVIAGFVMQISRLRWCVVILAIAMVLTAEMINTALERLARAITSEENRDVRNALDIASGAVLLSAVGAAIVGFIALGQPLLEMLR